MNGTLCPNLKLNTIYIRINIGNLLKGLEHTRWMAFCSQCKWLGDLLDSPYFSEDVIFL